MERLRFYFLVGAHTIINNDEFKAEVEKHLIEMCCGISASSLQISLCKTAFHHLILSRSAAVHVPDS